MKLILRFIALKMSILRVDAAIIKRKKVKRNDWAKELVGWECGMVTGKYMKMGLKKCFCVEVFVE